MLTFFLCVLFVATSHAADIKSALYPQGPMFGGRSIEIEQVPYMVTICQEVHYNSSYSIQRPISSGFLISKNYVLTTVPPVLESIRRGGPLYVRTNSSLRNVGVKMDYKVTHVETHDFFSVNEHGLPVNDLALLKIELPDRPNSVEQAPIKNLFFEPAKLFNETEDISAGVDALVIGWTNINGSNDQHLTARIVPTLDTSLCEKAYENVGGVPAGQICVAYPGENGKDGCQGDSGSPLIVDGRVAGILSWGNGCIKSHYPGLYTKIGYYRGWIEKNMKNDFLIF